jgi:hypothetical protein
MAQVPRLSPTSEVGVTFKRYGMSKKLTASLCLKCQRVVGVASHTSGCSVLEHSHKCAAELARGSAA